MITERSHEWHERVVICVIRGCFSGKLFRAQAHLAGNGVQLQVYVAAPPHVAARGSPGPELPL